MKEKLSPARITLIYVAFGTAWIAFSDYIVAWLVESPEALSTAQTIKGLFYIVLTGALVFGLVARAQHDLRQSEARYRLAHRVASVGAWEWDLATDRVYWSPETEAVFGLSPGQFGGTVDDVAQRIHPDDRKRWRTSVQACLEEGREHDIQFRITMPDGTIHWLDTSGNAQRDDRGKPLRMLGVIMDITDRKRAEQALRESEQRYRSLFETMTEGVAVHRVVRDDVGKAINYRIIDVNPAFKQHTGIDREKAVGRLATKAYDVESAPYLDHYEGVVATGEPMVFETGFRALSKSFRVSAVSLGDDLFVTVFEDITARKKAEHELQQHRNRLEELVHERTAELETAHEQLLRKERLATLGQLTASVAHELRNPLGTVEASFFTIKESVADRARNLDDVFDRAERGIHRCDRIIEELLDLTRAKTPDFTLTRIDEWLNALLDESPVPQDVTLIRRLHAGVELPIDREKLHRALLNLLTNAWQAMAEPGACGRELAVETAVADDNVVIRVTDQGAGIPMEHQNRIFEPLFSTKGFGVGLGLSIVRQIAELHAGRVDLTSAPGRGTTAVISLAIDPRQPIQ